MRNSVGKELHAAVKSTASIIYTSELIRSGQQEQPEGAVECKKHRPRWQYGANPQDSIDLNARIQPVSIPGEGQAFQCLLSATVTTNAPVHLHFIAGLSVGSQAGGPDEFLSDSIAEIMGWTLSCNSVHDEDVRFRMTGGIT